MPRHDRIDVEGEDTIEAGDPSAKIAIAEPGEAAHEQEVARNATFWRGTCRIKSPSQCAGPQ